MKTLLPILLIVSSQAFAGGAVVAGGLISPLMDSKLRIMAALNTIKDSNKTIGSVKVLPAGSVKIDLTKVAAGNDMIENDAGAETLAPTKVDCGLVIQIKTIALPEDQTEYVAEEPKEAQCE